MDIIDYFRAGMWMISGVTALVAIIVGLVLTHHWRNYTMEQGVTKKAMLVYFSISVLLIVIMIAMTPAL